MSLFPTKNGSSAPPPATAPSTDLPTLNVDLPSDFDNEANQFYVEPDARPGYAVDEAEEMLALAEEMGRPRVYGWLPGPVMIARTIFFSECYDQAREQALAAGAAEQQWPAPEQLTPDEKARLAGVDPHGAAAPSTPSSESIAIWQHHRRVSRALAQVAAIRDENARRAAHDKAHRCSTCEQVLESVTVREVLLVKVRCCGTCEVILRAGLISVLAREKLADGRGRGEAVAAWLGDHEELWAGVQFPAPPNEWASPTPPMVLPGKAYRPKPPPTIGGRELP